MKAIRIASFGGPEVMEYLDFDPPAPKAGEVRIRNSAIGVNFGDAYFRSGLYPVSQLPTGIGSEASGVIEAVGPGVGTFKVGERVAYVEGVNGSYANVTNVSANRLVALPEWISDEIAASSLAKGLTAQMLIRQVFKVEAGQCVLVHSAAGGVGGILSQWVRSLGATVIGTTSSRGKMEKIRENGCHHVLCTNEANWVGQVRAITGGEGTPVAFDSVGFDTFIGSLDCLAPRGVMVSYGNSSGRAPAIEPLELMRRGSLTLVRPYLGHYMTSSIELQAMADDFFAAVASSAVKLSVGAKYPLFKAADVHRMLAARETIGSSVLIP